MLKKRWVFNSYSYGRAYIDNSFYFIFSYIADHAGLHESFSGQYAQVIRNLKGEHENRPNRMTKLQLDNLRKRLYMARSMQIYGVISLLLCVVVLSLSISACKLWRFTRSELLCYCW